MPVYRRLAGDTLTPVTAFHKIDAGSCGCLFESVIGGEKVGRYSFLTADPFMQIELRGPRITVVSAQGTEEFESPDPLAELQRRVESFKAVHLPELPPFTGGAIGYAGYDVVRYTERLPNPPLDDRHLPDLAFAFYDRMVVFDHINKTIVVVAMARLDQLEPADAYRDAQRRIDAMVERLSTSADLPPIDIDTAGAPQIPYKSNCTQDEYQRAVERCVEYIRAGDIFQVVISQRLEVDIHAAPLDIYRALRVVNPSPFMFYLRTPSRDACSAVRRK